MYLGSSHTEIHPISKLVTSVKPVAVGAALLCMVSPSNVHDQKSLNFFSKGSRSKYFGLRIAVSVATIQLCCSNTRKGTDNRQIMSMTVLQSILLAKHVTSLYLAHRL